MTILNYVRPFVCLCSSASLVLQYGGFVPREWLVVKGLFFCLLSSFFIYPVLLNTVYVVHSLLTKWYRFNSRYLSPCFLNSSNLTQNETLVRLQHFFRVMLATRPFSQTIRKMPEDPYLFPLFLVQHKVYDLSRADRAWIIAAYKLGWPIFVYNYYLLVSLIATSREKLGRRCFDFLWPFWWSRILLAINFDGKKNYIENIEAI